MCLQWRNSTGPRTQAHYWPGSVRYGDDEILRRLLGARGSFKCQDDQVAPRHSAKKHTPNPTGHFSDVGLAVRQQNNSPSIRLSLKYVPEQGNTETETSRLSSGCRKKEAKEAKESPSCPCLGRQTGCAPPPHSIHWHLS